MTSRARWLSVLAAIVVVVGAVYALIPGEERRVRARVDALAAALATPANEPDLKRLARIAGLRRFFTDDVAVYFADEAHQPVRGRDELAGLVGQSMGVLGPFTVRLDNVRIAIRDGNAIADVHLDGRLLSADGRSEARIIDARSVGLTLTKVDGTWLVSGARVMPSDDAVREP